MRNTNVVKWGVCLNVILFGVLASTTVQAQHRVRHHLVNSAMAPGTIARQFLLGDPSLANHVQPIQFVVPGESKIAVMNEGEYSTAQSNRLLVGLGYGPVYRFKVSGIHRHPGIDLYPSVEMVGRLNPPEGLAVKHPVRVVLDQSDLNNAIAGRMITKVVYIENPETALPFRRRHGQQPYFDCGPSEDPFLTAEGLGRVMLIVRMGSRMPLSDDEFGQPLGGPAVQFYEDQPSEELNTQHQPDTGVRQVSYVQDVETPPIVSPGAMNSASRVLEKSPRFRFHATPNRTVHSEPNVPELEGAPTFSPYVARKPIAETKKPVTKARPVAARKTVRKIMGQDAASNDVMADAKNECLESEIPAALRDEWVCDGSDRNKRVSIDSTARVNGLDIEDTVAHFDTLEGETIVSPSNRVCIYSPRFAAVRKVHVFSGARTTTRSAALVDETKLERTRGMDFDATTLQNVRLQGYRKEYRPSSFRDRTRGVVADNTIHLNGTHGSFSPFEDFHIMRFGRFNRSEGTRLQLGMQSAVVWNDNLEAQMTVQNARAIIVDDKVQAKELVTVKSDHHPKLRLCKIASRISANPGEIVEFSIRFDNVGQEMLNNVAVMDNLSPRLEYVEGSATCTVDVEFDTEANEAGSLRLRWTMSEPLEVRSGGVIRFQCRVR